MGRTIPSFRVAAETERTKWRPFRMLLNKKDRKMFDEMLSYARLYNSACMMVARPVVFHAVLMSIVFEHYKNYVEWELNSSGKIHSKGVKNDLQ